MVDKILRDENLVARDGYHQRVLGLNVLQQSKRESNIIDDLFARPDKYGRALGMVGNPVRMFFVLFSRNAIA
jgi:hypothetical protein